MCFRSSGHPDSPRLHLLPLPNRGGKTAGDRTPLSYTRDIDRSVRSSPPICALHPGCFGPLGRPDRDFILEPILEPISEAMTDSLLGPSSPMRTFDPCRPRLTSRRRSRHMHPRDGVPAW